MKKYTLTVIDTKSIQKYIFGTNKLQQNAGASYLVDCTTRYWVVDCLPRPHNVIDIDATEMDKKISGQKIEDGKLASELLYTGGGNAVVLFKNRDLAVEFAGSLTRRVIQKAPGLEIILVHRDIDWQNESLNDVLQQAMEDLAKRKADRFTSTPQLGLGVTASCVYTGLPAVDYEKDTGRIISAEVKAKTDAAEEAHKRLENLLGLNDYKIPKDFEDFGRTRGESSYIAVVHIDGNQMGMRIKKYIQQNSPDNRSLIDAQRKFSNSIEKTAQEVLKKTTGLLVKAIKPDEKGSKKIAGTIELRENKIPFRPIVLGGDDLTFASDGRLGLTLASYYLRESSKKNLVDKKPFYCRAGVAVIKTRFPFARGYALAEELCASAKKRIAELRDPGEDDATVMDWHFAAGGLLEDLEAIRKREYTVKKGEFLYMRPVSLSCDSKDWRSWTTFERLVREFKEGETWKDRRNKVKALRETLRIGSGEAVEYFLKAYNLTRLPDIPEMPEMSRRGWQAGRCGYFDAIEAMDFYIPLEERVAP